MEVVESLSLEELKRYVVVEPSYVGYLFIEVATKGDGLTMGFFCRSG